MRGTSTIGAGAVQSGRARRSPGCGAMVRGGAGGRVERRRRGLAAMSGRRGLGAVSRRVVEVGLTEEALEALAQRVAQLLRAEPAPEQKPVTAGQLAHYLGVERSWVYKHRHLLGGWRINDGPKAQWRFDRETAKRRLAGQRAAQTTNGDL
jgi:hypothetical protein